MAERDEGRRRYPRARVAAAVIAVVPQLVDEDMTAVLQAARVLASRPLAELAAHLSGHPDALTSGDPRCPQSVIRLTHVLHEAGHAGVVRPPCAGCGTITVGLNAAGDAGRMCGPCARQHNRKPCARCGRTARIAARRSDGAICFTCYNTDPDVIEPCSQCGQLRRPTGRRADSSPLCKSCWSAPTRSCISCGQVRATALITAEGPVCPRCYNHHHRPRRECGQCGRVRLITKRGTGDQPDLCRSCHRGPEDACSACGRTRLLQRRPDGTRLCRSCTPRPHDRCCRCNQHRAIAARWPIGAVCHSCYHAILNNPAECARCRTTRPLLARDKSSDTNDDAASGAAGVLICGPCAGVDAAYICSRCGHSGHPFRAGLCAYCVLHDRLHHVMAGPDGTVSPQLQPVVAAFAATPRPRSVISSLAQSPSLAALSRLAATGEPISHERLDELPPGRNEYYVRQLLVATGVLPARNDDLERLPAWLDTTLADKPAEHARLIQPFAHWFVLRRARRRATQRRQPAIVGDYLRTQITIALSLLSWLDEQDIALADLDQPSLDTWLAAGNTNNYNVRNFLLWATARGVAPELVVPVRPRHQPDELLDDSQRWNLLQRCLTDDTLDLGMRAATALLLLFGLPISRIRHLTADQLDTAGSSSFLRVGRHPLLLPPRLANLLHQLADTPHTAARITATGGDSTRWLFPGLTPGRPMSAIAFTHRLRDLGVKARTARNAALMSLAGDLPVPILADILGMHTGTADRWAHLAQRDWTAYIAERATDTPPGPR